MENTNKFNDTMTRLQNQTLGQAIDSEAISSRFAKGLKNKIVTVGLAAVLGSITLMSSGVAMAGSNNNTFFGFLGLSGVAGTLIDGWKPSEIANSTDCANVRGFSGATVGTGMAAGSAISYLASEKNRTVTAIGGSAVVGGLLAYKEMGRMEAECKAAIARADQERARQAQAEARAYGNNSAGYGAAANPASTMPTEPILYLERLDNGGVAYVTTSNSIAIKALNGYRDGSKVVNDDPIVKRALDVTYNNYGSSYKTLQESSQKYLDFVSGKDSTVKAARYSLGSEKVASSSATLQGKAKELLQNVDSAYNTYAQSRAEFYKIAKEATIDGFNIREGYSAALNWNDTPQELKQVFYNAGAQLNNRYPTNPLN